MDLICEPYLKGIMYMHAFSIFANNKNSSIINSWNLSPQKAWLEEQFVLCSRRMRWLMSNRSWCQNWILLPKRTSLACCFCAWDMMEMMSSSSKFLLIIKLLGCIENVYYSSSRVFFLVKPYNPKTPPANLSWPFYWYSFQIQHLWALCLLWFCKFSPSPGLHDVTLLLEAKKGIKKGQMQLRLDCDVFLSDWVLFSSTVA